MTVAVTGMGVVSPLGAGIPGFWAALCRGESGIRPITRFRTEGMAFTAAGEIPAACTPAADADGEPDIATRFAVAAGAEALRDAGIEGESDAGIVLATNFGGAVSGERFLERVAAGGTGEFADFLGWDFMTAADRVAGRLGLTGPRLAVSLSCCSGAAAIGVAGELIRAERAGIVVAIGYDALSRFAWSGLSALRTMTRDAVRPFDRRRSGTIFAEGAGALVIESAVRAAARGAEIRGRVRGWAMNNNAFHLTAPSPGGAGSAAVISAALRHAGLAPEDVDFVSAHGTGTRQNDVAEREAFDGVFGERGCRVPVTAIKSMTGHMMGASGSVEAIAALLAIRHGVIPPTINFAEADPDCAVNLVANRARPAKLGAALCNSAGIGGCNAAVVLTSAD